MAIPLDQLAEARCLMAREALALTGVIEEGLALRLPWAASSLWATGHAMPSHPPPIGAGHNPGENDASHADPAMVFLPRRRPAPPRQPPEPQAPRRRELDDTPAGPAPFPAAPFLQAVEAVAEQEGSEALGGIQWALLGHPRLRSLLDGAASRGSDGLQSLLRERYPAVVPGDAEGYLVAIRAHLRALLRDDSGMDLAKGEAASAAPADAMPQQKPLAGSGEGGSGDSVTPAAALAGPSSQRRGLNGGEPLAGAQRRRLEGAFGEALSDVRLHRDAEAARLSRSLGARAFTYGPHVVFGAQQYAPGTAGGDALLAHELAHVLQQRGASSPSLQSDQRGLESQADHSAADVMARLWGQELLGTVDLPSPQPLSRSGLAFSGCSRSRREAPTGTETGVHLDVGDISNKINNVDLGEFNPPELSKTNRGATKHQEVKRDEALKNMTRSQPGSIYVWFGHGTIPDGQDQAVGLNAADHTVFADDIYTALASSDKKDSKGNPVSCAPTLFVAGGCGSASLLKGINDAGTPIAMGFSRTLDGKHASKAVEVFMAKLNSKETFEVAKNAAEIVAKEDANTYVIEALKRGSNDARALNEELVKVTYRAGYNSGMKLDEARSQHLQEHPRARSPTGSWKHSRAEAPPEALCRPAVDGVTRMLPGDPGSSRLTLGGSNPD